MTADEALQAHGFDGHKLLAYAHTIARREMQTKASTLGDRHEDLVMWLVEVGCRTALNYNPTKSAPTYTFGSYLYDVMDKRVEDFYRRKGEGFGDQRKGHNGRIVLTENPEIDDDFDFAEIELSKKRIARWQAAADRANMEAGTSHTLEHFILISMDQTADRILKGATP